MFLHGFWLKFVKMFSTLPIPISHPKEIITIFFLKSRNNLLRWKQAPVILGLGHFRRQLSPKLMNQIFSVLRRKAEVNRPMRSPELKRADAVLK